MKTDIFHLQIVKVEDILPHEYFDDKRAIPLVEELKKDQYLANPIIVASIEDGKYLQLDGMNRFTAFKKLGLPTILTQIIDYNNQEDVELSSWCHFFSLPIEDFLQSVKNTEKLTVETGKINQVGHRYIKEEGLGRLCTVVTRERKVYLLVSLGGLAEKVRQLNSVVSHYEKQIIRDVLPQNPMSGQIDLLFDEHPDSNIMIIFPTFTRHQIVEVVRRKLLFPPGITRYIIKRRCLNLNIPLSLFTNGKTIGEQNQELEKNLGKRSYRIYEEPTVYFE